MSRRSERKAEGARSNGRPKGEERVAIAAAARALQAERRAAPLTSPEGLPLVGATGLELMQRARVGRRVSAVVVKNMVRGHELVKVGKVQVAGVARLLTVYALPEPTEQPWTPGYAELDVAICAMARLQG